MGHRRISVLLLAVAGCVSVTVASGPSAAQNAPADFYRGKTVSIVIGSAAGGGFDSYGRLVSRHLGRFIPGNPNVIVQNMPGAGSNKAASYVAVQAAQDGLSIGAVQAIAITQPLVSDKPVLHDPSKLQMLASANSSVFFCTVRSDAPVKTFQETFDKEVVIGMSTEGATLYSYPIFLRNILGVKFKLVGGYAGSREIMLAMERNEVQGMCGMDWSSFQVQQTDWVSSGFARLLVQEDLTGHPTMNKMGIPLSISFAKTDEVRDTMELVYSQNLFGRPFIVGPGVPADRVAALRAAFDKMLVDPALLAEAQKSGLDFTPTAGVELQKVVTKLYAYPPNIIAKAKAAMILRP